jgi:hypothetical protein
MINYVEVKILRMNSRPLGFMTVRRSSATEHDRGNGILSDDIPLACGASELWRSW